MTLVINVPVKNLFFIGAENYSLAFSVDIADSGIRIQYVRMIQQRKDLAALIDVIDVYRWCK